MRRLPQQQRSRETVERILVAARGVLVDVGYDGFSTNRVADRAGVSPGSLYQYFPDKAAVLDAVVDRYWDEVADQVVLALTDRLGETGRDLSAGVAEALLDAVDRHSDLVRVVVDVLPPVRYESRRRALEQRVGDLVTTYLVMSGVPPEAARVRAWAVVTSASALATRYVLDRPPLERSALVAEMARLLGGGTSG